MIKKLLLISLVVSQLTISCTSEDSKDENVTETEQSLAEQIANIIKQPYSKLTPAEQKVKLEAEANEMLVQLDKTKNLSAIEAIENLNRLLDINTVDIFNGLNDNEVENIINTSGVYGVYTWNNTDQKWVKAASTSELKFIFPAKKSQTTNNASFSANSTSSDIKVEIEDNYNWQTDTQINDHFFLPTSTDAVLKIDNVNVATFSQTAKYSNGKQAPDEFNYKMTLIEGYTWEMSSIKTTQNTAKALFSYNGKNLISFNSSSSANIDELLKDEPLAQYRGKANGLVTIMDNFVIVADMDLATSAADEVALEKNNPRPTYPVYNDPNADFRKYYTALNTYYQKESEGNVGNYNKNLKLILVSKKEGTKIADIVVHSEKESSYTNNLPVWSQDGYWTWDGQGETFTEQYYDEVYYLKFSDNTEVEMSAYFSTGFEDFEAKFEDFIKAFEK